MNSKDFNLRQEIQRDLQQSTTINVALFAGIALMLAFLLCREMATPPLAQSAPVPVQQPITIEPETPQEPPVQPFVHEAPLPRTPNSPQKNNGLPGGALWKFKSQVWSGYIDIRTDGLYYTHWGYGHWQPQADGSVLLTNDYDGFTHHLRFDDASRKTMSGERNDSTWERCELLLEYAKMKQPY